MGIYKIRQKNGSLRWVASRYLPDGGRLRVRCISRAQAQAVWSRIDTAIKDGTWEQLRAELTGKREPATELTVDAMFARYLEQYCQVRLRTPQVYAYHLGRFSKRFGQLRAEDIRRQHLHQYVAEMTVAGYKPATINMSAVIVRAAFAWAVEQEIMVENRIKNFPKLKVQRRNVVPLTPEEVERIVANAETPEWAALFCVLAETGLRKMEALTLTWAQVDFSAGVITTARTKNYKPRTIPISASCETALRGLVRYVGVPQVFVDPRTGQRLSTTDRWLKRAAAAAGVGNIGFHDFRRYRASRWLTMQLDVMEIAELLGHSSLETTRRYLGVARGLIARVKEAQSREIQAQNRHKESEAI